MRKCGKCGAYTLDEKHCGMETASPHPPKYSHIDRYAKYRRQTMQN